MGTTGGPEEDLWYSNIETNLMPADGLTKRLDRVKFAQFVKQLRLEDIPEYGDTLVFLLFPIWGGVPLTATPTVVRVGSTPRDKAVIVSQITSKWSKSGGCVNMGLYHHHLRRLTRSVSHHLFS
jgi:hypothetical protein